MAMRAHRRQQPGHLSAVAALAAAAALALWLTASQPAIFQDAFA
eukprot:CAMPEP_0177414268 /NCGR_PEP_ID=MMETSP0368-20130122/66965_1 /TAXON_ID=447022 ORGANISM="Scrippsiella hangoei-like, Strain SHHI-4" /NCGR_SAMPLE_ID=MMETSP0368 /ASSEMBLY_ACC=CAM_ASM_000363 /LENGTH=43 /DNA_ID= /DNA_START= /DNA_END= /DNA_ORIENTATION=